MKEIPQHCVDTFKERFGVHPSIIEVYPNMSKEDTDKFLNKSILRKSQTKIFILTKVDKQNVVDYILLQIKRLTKKD